MRKTAIKKGEDKWHTQNVLRASFTRLHRSFQVKIIFDLDIEGPRKKNIITSLPLIRCVLLLQHFFSRYILLAPFPHFFFHVIVHKLTKDIHPEFWRRQTGGVIPRIERRCYIGWVVIVIDGQLQDVKVLRSRARRKKKNLRIFSYYAILV